VIELFKRYKIETEGKHCVIVGRSNIVGKPMAMLMMQKLKSMNATVTVCHSATPNNHCRFHAPSRYFNCRNRQSPFHHGRDGQIGRSRD